MSLTKFNRREMLVSSLTAVAASVVGKSIPMLAEEPNGQLNDQIQILTSSDPKFRQLVEAHFPGSSLTLDSPDLWSYTILCRNNSNKPIRACTTEWSIHREDGTVRLLKVHSMSRGARKPHKPNELKERLLPGTVTLVQAGEMFLATPFFICAASRHTYTAEDNSIDQLVRAGFKRKPSLGKHLLGSKGPWGSPTGRVVAVMFPRGELVSSIHNPGLGRRFFGRRHAEQGQARSLLKFIKEGHSQEELAAELDRRIAKPVGRNHKHNERISARSIKRYAGFVLRHLNKKGLEKTRQHLELVTRLPRMQPKFSRT